MLGRTVGRFRVVAKLGEGGMGSVWRAEDSLLGRPVALKFLPDSVDLSPSARKRFLREARATSALSHPGIATVYDVGEWRGRLYIAIALVEGETLSDFCARGPVPIAEAMRIVAEVAEALEHAHTRGVLHRDVTARNIMCTPEGRAVLIDFGLALRDGTSRISASGATFGTVPYIAPEVAMGRPADFRSDLYGLGVVFYELIAGRLPFDHEAPLATLYAAAHSKPTVPSALRSECSPALDRLALRLLAKDPDRRPQSAAALAEELRSLLGSVAAATNGTAVTRRVPRPPAGAGAPKAPRSAAASRKCILILPFQAPTDAPFAHGVAEALSVALGNVSQLRIIAPTPAMHAEDFERELEQRAAQLGAGVVLRGTVRRADADLRVSYSLVRVKDGSVIAGDTIHGRADDLFALEDALVASVVGALKVDLARRTRRIGELQAAGAHEKYLRALGYLQRSDVEAMVDGGIRLLEELLAAEGDTALVHAALGRAYLMRYQLTFDPQLRKKAEASCRLALQLAPHSPEVLVILGRLHLKAGRYEEAAAALEQSLDLRRDEPEALLFLSRAREALGQFDAAVKAAQSAIALRPDHWAGHHALATLHYRHGQYLQAIELWERVVELSSDNAVARSNLGAAYFQLGRLDDSLAAYEGALAITPTATSCFGAGTVKFFLGQRPEAVAMFERAVALTPHDARAWGNLADAQRWTVGWEGDSRASFDRAIALVREQVRLNPKDAQAWSRLALWLAKRGSTSESIASIGRATSLSPGNVDVLARGVTVHHLAGNRAAALGCLAGALGGGYGLIELAGDPELASLREDPETRRLLNEAETSRGAVRAPEANP
ncbi:MAG: protein kinase [Candidatus Eisenbacteria bacterium]